MKSIDIYRIIKKSIYNFFFKLEFKSYINNSENENKIIDKNNYFFVLDLSSFTPNFDITKNLIYLAIKSLYKKIHIVIIPEMKNAHRVLTKEKKIKNSNYFRRINIVYPLINMINDFKPNIYFPSTREEAYRIIENKNITKLTNPFLGTERKFISESILFKFYKKKKFIPRFEPNISNLDFVKKKIKFTHNEKFISISIRGSSYNSEYNSNKDSWKKIARILKKRGFKIVIIREFEEYFENENDEFIYFDQAIFDPQIRLSIYKLCILNLGVCNGPFNSFIFYTNCNFLCFKGHLVKKDDYLRRYGEKNLDIDFQLPFFNKNQKILYFEDTFENIFNEINIFFKNNGLNQL